MYAPGITCDNDTLDVANITDANLTGNIDLGKSITLICLGGHKFSDMELRKTINCTRSGWSSAPSVCEGTLT